MEVGVLPVPPTYILPMQMIGSLKTLGIENFFFKKVKKTKSSETGIKIIEKILIFLSQNFGLLKIIF